MKPMPPKICTARSAERPNASEALGRAADRAVQIHGGMGFMRDCAVEGIYREARMMRIVEGTSEIQRMLIARGVLG